MTKSLNVTILMDNPNSWFIRYADQLSRELTKRGHHVARVAEPADLPEGDCALFLSVQSIVPQELLKRHAHNIVIHASAVPKGKGWSPLTWQILEGKNEITTSLFEAADRVDSGVVYGRETIQFNGTELIDELREKEAKVIISLALKFVDTFPPHSGEVQSSEESFYRRRKPEDSEIDPTKSIIDNFNALRVADNERYPAFFTHNGCTYVLKIYKKAKS
jgi:methionyl-tRNA formyltransferase